MHRVGYIAIRYRQPTVQTAGIHSRCTDMKYNEKEKTRGNVYLYTTQEMVLCFNNCSYYTQDKDFHK